jgi:hypothetical protein
MNHIKLIPTFQRKKSIPKQLKDLELIPLNEKFSKLTMPIISDDDMRPAMMGNFFDMESKKIVSTDAHKLTAINMPDGTYNFIAQKYKKQLNENPKGLIFHTLKQMQNDYNDLVKLLTKNNTDDVQSFDEYVKIREIEDAKYPNYDAVIPKEFTNEIYVDFTKLYWYSKVLLDARIIDDKTKINSSNENEYQNKKIEYLKDSYVPFLSSAKHIILTYTLDGKKEFIGFNAKLLCDILKFSMEYNGKTFGKVGISGNSRAMVIEFENGLYSPSDSIGLIMPLMINGFNVIGDIDTHDTYYMYYNLDNNTILSGTKLNNVEDFNTYEIDETIGFKANKESLSIPKIRVEEKVTTEVTSDNSYIDDINIDNKILIVEEKGKPLSTYKNGDKVFWANLSFDKNWKQYVEGEVFIKDDEYSIKRFPQNPNFKKYPLSTFNSNTKVVLKPNNEPNYSDKTIKNNGVKNTQNDSMTFITNRIKGLKIALKVARAENKPKIQKRILGLEIAKKMQNPKYSVAKKVANIEKVNKVDSEQVYIQFMNKDKAYTQDTKNFNSYADAVSWGKENLDNFNLDMINYKFNNGGGVVSKENSIKEFFKKFGFNVEDIQKDEYSNGIEGWIVFYDNKNKYRVIDYSVAMYLIVHDKTTNKTDIIKQSKSFNIDNFNNGGGVESSLDYKIIEGYDHYNNYPLYQVVGKDNDYIGEYHTDIKDAKKELKEFENEKFNKGGRIKEGDKFGNYSITKYSPITYDDLGSSNNGLVKLVNQEDFDTILIQYDNALRSGKWFVSKNGRRYEGKNPNEVIDKLNLNKMNKGGVVFTDYNGSEIMYEPNYDEYFVNDEVF